MKTYFGYIRVSTVKQGEKGSSLQEQKSAIDSYARRHNLTIAEWYEETETAAKYGRPIFTKMLKALERGLAAGVITHKIDRSARNLRDWATLGEAIDRGIEVHFAHESIDLTSRGGRLSADIQAVVAADYIRNLREEVRKGFYGRLKQGLYPLGAPIGYLDQGGGKPKIPDPVRMSFIRAAFDMYATGDVSLPALADELYRLGLRNKAGTKVNFNRLSEILHNPFYMGLLRIKRTGEFYQGIHEPIVSATLFERVQKMLSRKANRKVDKHDFIFRRFVRCSECGTTLIGERQRGHAYYRCHNRECSMTGIREEMITQNLYPYLGIFDLSDAEAEEMKEMSVGQTAESSRLNSARRRSIALQLESANARLSRLTDGYLDQTIEPALFLEKKRELLLEHKKLEEQQANLDSSEASIAHFVSDYLEHVRSMSLSYEMANPSEKRQILRTITSNISASQKNVDVELHSPFREVIQDHGFRSGAPYRGIPRTNLKRLLEILISCAKQQDRRISTT
jgi:DNA invertase Pin-like site-specific DNA recombinase